MQGKTFRFIVMEADTRTLETFLSLFSFTWGVWIAFTPITTFRPEFWVTVQQTGTVVLWCLWSLFNSLFKLFASAYAYPKLRRWASSLAAVYWVIVAYSLSVNGPSGFLSCMAGLLAVGELWIVLHRCSIGR